VGQQHNEDVPAHDHAGGRFVGVKDLDKSIEFCTKLGYTFNPQFTVGSRKFFVAIFAPLG